MDDRAQRLIIATGSDAGELQLWSPEGQALLQMYLDDHLPASVRAEYDVRVD